jgi:hypothetical protein
MNQQFTSLFDVIDQLQAEAHNSRIGVMFKSAGTGEELKEEALTKVFNKTPKWYQDKFIESVRSIAPGSLITVEDVRDRAGNPPIDVSPNCMGGLMARAAKLGLITKTFERRKAKRKSLHASELAVWRRIAA